MTISELIAQLQTRDPAALVLIDHENHGFWYLDLIDGVQDIQVRRNELNEYEQADDGVAAVRIW